MSKTCRDMDEICKNILKKYGDENMAKKITSKITGFMREYVLVLSIITSIIGVLLFLMGVIRFMLPDAQLGFYTDIIDQLGYWTFYLILIGFIVIATGIYYIYSFFSKKKFVLEEIQTNKRSELLKRHADLKFAVKHLPSKYGKMLREKENELRIK